MLKPKDKVVRVGAALAFMKSRTLDVCASNLPSSTGTGRRPACRRGLKAGRLWLTALLLSVFLATPVLAADTTDLRVLVDVSGSMKKNDPSGLRIAASNLLIDLLPQGASAAVWTFAGGAEPLVPLAGVDTAWRERARAAVPAIHSRGQFTDMRTVLEAATRDWREAGPPAPDAPTRALILLTDGVVDVADGPTASAVSRNFILGDLVTDLKSLGVNVHTVALSRSADRELLAALADATEGRYELAEDAAALNRVFLRMFEQSVARDAVPLAGNRFTIDSSISEFTLVAFHGDSPKTITLTTPLGTALDATTRDPDIRWRRDQGYDLITIAQPPPGEWVLSGAEDPDNRVMIVTNLGLEVDPLPGYILSDENLTARFRLTEGDIPITRADFLDLVEADVRVDEAAPMPAKRLAEGDFETQIAPLGSRGERVLKFTARGETFERVTQRRVTVLDNPLRLDARVLPTAEVQSNTQAQTGAGSTTVSGTESSAGAIGAVPQDGTPGDAGTPQGGEPADGLSATAMPSIAEQARRPELTLEIDEAVLQPGSVRLVVVQHTPTNGQIMTMTEDGLPPALDAWLAPGEYALDALATAVTRRGRLVQVRAPALTHTIRDYAAEEEAERMAEAAQSAANGSTQQGFSWPLLAIVLGVGNVALGTGVFLAVRAIKRQAATPDNAAGKNREEEA